MRVLRAWLSRLRESFTPSRSDRELADELAAHLNLQMGDDLRAGLKPEEARRSALLKLGGLDATMEGHRDRRRLPLIDTVMQDVRYAVRSLRRNPVFAIASVLTLTLGIGANTAIFSIVNATLLRPLPYADSDRLMRVFHAYAKLNMPATTISPAYFDYYRKNARSFSGLAALVVGFRAPINLTGAGDPERLQTCQTTWNLFELLGVRPSLGRTFVPQEDQPGSGHVAVLSDALWRRRFGGDPQIIGRSITLDSANYTVIGVMPAGFAYPADAELWVPLALTPQGLSEQIEYLDVVGRLRAGVDEAHANAELASLSQQLLARDGRGRNDIGWSVYAAPMQEAAVGDVRLAVLVLFGAVGCVLLIACANVTNLLLARGASRRREIAIRGALGASRSRVCRQLMTEGVVLGLVGGACGVACGYWGLSLLLSSLPMRIPSFIRIHVDGTVMLFTLVLAVGTGLLFSMVPALRLSNMRANDTLKDGGRSSAGGPRHALSSTIVVAQIAASLVLLIGAGLLAKSFIGLVQSSYGFNPSNVLTMEIALPETRYGRERQTAFFSQVLDRVSALPGVQSAAVTMNLPVQGGGMRASFSIAGKQFALSPHAHIATISPRYFETLGIPVLSGRVFDGTDRPDTNPVAIIDSKAAKAYFGNENPLGHHLVFTFEGTRDRRISREIVGVVGAVEHETPTQSDNLGQVFLPYTQWPVPYMNLAVRTAADPTILSAAVQRAVLSVDPAQPVARVRTMDVWLREFVSVPRFNMTLLAGFAVLALVLSIVGIYGVLAYSVAQQTREFGVRMALGAQRSHVLGIVFSQALRLTSIGVASGLAVAFAATRALSTLLVNVTVTDPTTFAATSALFAVIALAASCIPALRATRVNPLAALRYE